MKMSWCYDHSGGREEQQAKESRDKLTKCVLSPGVKIIEAGNRQGFIPSTEYRDTVMVL